MSDRPHQAVCQLFLSNILHLLIEFIYRNDLWQNFSRVNLFSKSGHVESDKITSTEMWLSNVELSQVFDLGFFSWHIMRFVLNIWSDGGDPVIQQCNHQSSAHWWNKGTVNNCSQSYHLSPRKLHRLHSSSVWIPLLSGGRNCNASGHKLKHEGGTVKGTQCSPHPFLLRCAFAPQ